MDLYLRESSEDMNFVPYGLCDTNRHSGSVLSIAFFSLKSHKGGVADFRDEV